ncbi:MAG: hypothetical protein QF464_08935 [Myxococcota bacterium]|nr:hypothetical protein [Myxococcota bacterium]
MTDYRPGPDGKWQLEWIDKEAHEGPVFRIGPDVYSRLRPGQRVLELHAILAPGLNYLDAAVEGFREVAEHWKAPVLFIIRPDVRKPPAVRFLYQWSQSAFYNGSCDQTFMLTSNFFTQTLSRFVIRSFTDVMPTEAVQGRWALDQRLNEMDLACGREDFRIKSMALVPAGQARDGAFTQLLRRLVRRLGRERR